MGEAHPPALGADRKNPRRRYFLSVFARRDHAGSTQLVELRRSRKVSAPDDSIPKSYDPFKFEVPA